MPNKIEVTDRNLGNGTHQYVCSCGTWEGNPYHDSDGTSKSAAFQAAARHMQAHKN